MVLDNMKKYYRITSKTAEPLKVLKWLRTRGELNKDFFIVGASYHKLELEFNNPKLELEYVMRYDWLLA